MFTNYETEIKKHRKYSKVIWPCNVNRTEYDSEAEASQQTRRLSAVAVAVDVTLLIAHLLNLARGLEKALLMYTRR